MWFFFLQFFRNISWIDLNFHADTSGLAVEHWHFDTSIWILTLPYLQLNLNIKTPLLYVSQCKWKNGPSPFGQRGSCRRPAHYFFKFIQHTHQRHIRMQTDTHTHTQRPTHYLNSKNAFGPLFVQSFLCFIPLLALLLPLSAASAFPLERDNTYRDHTHRGNTHRKQTNTH